MKVGILIITYHPDYETLNRIHASKCISRTIVLDNSEVNYEYESGFLRVVRPGENIGLARALSLMSKEFEKHNYSHFIYFDQDTYFSDEVVDEIGRMSDPELMANPLIHMCDSRLYRKKSYLRFVINSGSLFNIKLMKKIAFDERYFVDAVDLSTCQRVRLAGYKIIQLPTENIDHCSGQGLTEYLIFGRPFQVKNLSKWRKNEFLHGHFRLLGDSMRVKYTGDFLVIIKFLIAFLLHYYSSIFIRKFGKLKR